MEDQFEKYVKDHASEFDQFELPDGAWDTIKDKRNSRKPRKLIYLNALRRVAAVLVLGLAGYGLFSLATGGGKLEDKTAKLPKEIREMDRYYEAQFSEGLDELEQKHPSNKLVFQEVSAELEMLNEEKQKLIDELKLNFSNKKVLEELISVYRLRLEILEDVLSTLNEENEKDYDQDNSFNT
jgi:hypothetical protein